MANIIVTAGGRDVAIHQPAAPDDHTKIASCSSRAAAPTDTTMSDNGRLSRCKDAGARR